MLNDLLKTLNIDPRILLLNGILFLVLVQVMDKLFWKPILRQLDKRTEAIASAYRTVDDTRSEMERLRSEYQGRLAIIEAEARGRIQQTVRDAQDQREAVLAEARSRAEETGREGRAAIAAEVEQAVVSTRATLDSVALEIFTKITGSAGGPAQQALIDDYIARQSARS